MKEGETHRICGRCCKRKRLIKFRCYIGVRLKVQRLHHAVWCLKCERKHGRTDTQ